MCGRRIVYFTSLYIPYLRRLFICLICNRGQWSTAFIILIIFTLAHADTSSLPVEQPHTFQINFNSLYTALCEQQRSDQATLLLYTLLHQNANMRTYMLSRTDMDNLVGRTGMTTHSDFMILCLEFDISQQGGRKKRCLRKYIMQSFHTH